MPKECSFFLISVETRFESKKFFPITIFDSKKAGWYDPAFFAHRRKKKKKQNQTSAMHSTSQSTFFGRRLTATQERAGRLAIYLL